jgi:hypothetical protein
MEAEAHIPQHQLTPGAIVDGRYRVLRCLGTGSMGIVYLCQMLESPERLLALKLLAPSPTEGVTEADFLKRFMNEIAAIYRVQHPNVVATYDVIRCDGVMAYTMEYVAGCNLAQFMQAVRPVPLDTALRILMQVCSGLGAIHEADIIHRDLKPANILLGTNGVAKIADFGIARIRDTQRLTAHGGVVGTIEYLSPEYLADGVLSKLGDLYSLGLLAFKMISGKTPFRAPSMYAAIEKKMADEVTPLISLMPEIPQAVSDWVAKAIRRDPHERFSNAGEMLDQLSALDPELALSRHQPHVAYFSFPEGFDPQGQGPGTELPLPNNAELAGSDGERSRVIIGRPTTATQGQIAAAGATVVTQRDRIFPMLSGLAQLKLLARRRTARIAGAGLLVGLCAVMLAVRYPRVRNLEHTAPRSAGEANLTPGDAGSESTNASDRTLLASLQAPNSELADYSLVPPVQGLAGAPTQPPAILSTDQSSTLDVETGAEEGIEVKSEPVADTTHTTELTTQEPSAPTSELMLPVREPEIETPAVSVTQPKPAAAVGASTTAKIVASNVKPQVRKTMQPPSQEASKPKPEHTQAIQVAAALKRLPATPQAIATTETAAPQTPAKILSASAARTAELGGNTPDQKQASQELSTGQESPSFDVSDTKIKATLLYRLADYIAWPDAALARSDFKVSLCILGEDPFGKFLDSSVRKAKTLDGKGFKVLRLSSDAGEEELNACRILYIHPLENQRLAARIAKLPIVTVTDGTRYGMIDFFIKEGKVKFRIDVRKAEQAGIRFGHLLLDLAAAAQN